MGREVKEKVRMFWDSYHSQILKRVYIIHEVKPPRIHVSIKINHVDAQVTNTTQETGRE